MKSSRPGSGCQRMGNEERQVTRTARAVHLRDEGFGTDHISGAWQMQRRTCATAIILIVACACLQGCAAIVGGAAYGVEKIYLAEDRSPIYVTENDNAVVGCVFVMDAKGKRLLGGPFLEDQTLERVIADMTIEIYEGGANVLLIKEKSKGFWGSSVVGKGYRCTTIPAPPPKPIPK